MVFEGFWGFWGAKWVCTKVSVGGFQRIPPGARGALDKPWAPSIAGAQVCSAFVPMEDGTPDVQRSQAVMANARHQFWVKRRACSREDSHKWRPRKVHRLSTASFIVEQDNQIAVGTCHQGLVVFQPTVADEWTDKCWRTWPQACIACDQGPDAHSGIHAMMWKPSLMLNVWPWWEWSHGVNNDFYDVYNFTGTRDMQLLILIIANLYHGPDKDPQMRWCQYRDALQHMVEHQRPMTFNLFLARAPMMLEELGSEVTMVDGLSPEESLWE
jgi:hypothetical protein